VASSVEPRKSQSTPPTAAAPASAAETDEYACRAELIHSRRPLCHDFIAAGVAGPMLALVPAGSFEMGSTAVSTEQPVHRVTIREPFAISVYEVSQGEFREFCQRTSRSCASQPWSGDDYPVVNVSWDDARAYADWLSSVTHHRYRLPTEAQWEYAARAGQSGPYPGGDTLSPTDAHYSIGSKETAAAPRSQKFNANRFRLVHTLGNVREWVTDAWTQSFEGAPSDGSAVEQGQSGLRVVRGGSYADTAPRLRLSMRESLPAGTRDGLTGFRVVRELP
jgi:formylglycine-generating enzyme required for sulfatase activity